MLDISHLLLQTSLPVVSASHNLFHAQICRTRPVTFSLRLVYKDISSKVPCQLQQAKKNEVPWLYTWPPYEICALQLWLWTVLQPTVLSALTRMYQMFIYMLVKNRKTGQTKLSCWLSTNTSLIYKKSSRLNYLSSDLSFSFCILWLPNQEIHFLHWVTKISSGFQHSSHKHL